MAKNDDKLRQVKVVKLLGTLRELQAKTYDVTMEIHTLLTGGAGVGETLMTLRTAFDTFWCVRYAPGQQHRYVWSHEKDNPQLKRLLRSLSVDEIKQRMATYLGNEDPFYVKARHSFNVFIASVNTHATAPTPDFTLAAPTISGCRHVPQCVSDQEHTRRYLEDMKHPATAVPF